MNEVLKVGIMSREQFQKRILDATAGRTKLSKDDPKSGLALLNRLINL